MIHIADYSTTITKIGTPIELADGTVVFIADTRKGRYGKGFKAIYAFACDGPFKLHLRCACTDPWPIRGVNLVNETEFSVCASCNKKITA